LTLNPNPAQGTNGFATVTVNWSAPNSQYIEVRIGSPTGQLFTVNSPTGSMQTGTWVMDGMLFYLLDVSYPMNNTMAGSNTIATAIARVM
jgi:hypothetical protein